MDRWAGAQAHRNVVEVGLMVQVCKMAYLFDPKKHRAETWVFQRANAYCWDFRMKLQNESAGRTDALSLRRFAFANELGAAVEL
jgi:hypothetical protein